MREGRVLGLDYGEKRVGVALSDPLFMTAQPQPYIPHDNSLFSSIKTLVEDYDVHTIVLGLPLDREGNESKKSAEVRDFASTLSEHVACKISFQDERYSTKAVTDHLISGDVSRKKRKEVVDSLAAAFILQGYMDKCSRENNSK